MAIIRLAGEQIYKRRLIPGHLVRATASVDAFTRKGYYVVTVWGQPPDDETMKFVLKGDSERTVAMEGIRRFVEIMKTRREERLKVH